MKIGIIGAMSVEVEKIKSYMENLSVQHISGMDFFCGTLYGKAAVVAQCGVGKVFSGVCAQTMILSFGATHIINTGVGGTLTERLGILDIAIADGLVQHDMDTSPIGDPVGLISGINKIILPTDKALSDIACSSAKKLGLRFERGAIASGDQFIADGERKAFIVKNFGAICCEMEGAAIAQVCYINSIPFLCVRAISDSATGEAQMEFPKMAALAAEQSQALIEEIFKTL